MRGDGTSSLLSSVAGHGSDAGPSAGRRYSHWVAAEAVMSGLAEQAMYLCHFRTLSPRKEQTPRSRPRFTQRVMATMQTLWWIFWQLDHLRHIVSRHVWAAIREQSMGLDEFQLLVSTPPSLLA